VIRVVAVHDGQDVELDVVLGEHMQRVQHPLLRWAASRGRAIPIVVVTGAVQADAQKKVVLVQKVGPFRGQEQPVGLQTVAHRLAWRAVLLLKRHHLAEKVQAAERRLTALPTEGGVVTLQAHALPNESVQHLRAHAVPAGVLVRIRQTVMVEAVVAAQVAIARGGLDQQAAGGIVRGHRGLPRSSFPCIMGAEKGRVKRKRPRLLTAKWAGAILSVEVDSSRYRGVRDAHGKRVGSARVFG